MLKIANHPIFAHPLPEGHRFPMLKYELIPQQLLHHGLVREGNFFAPEPVDEQWVLLAHEENYWRALRDLDLSYAAQRRVGLPMSAQLVERELRIAQGTISGCIYALQFGVAFNVAGGTHHAGSNWGEGFCMLNDQAIAAHYLLKEGLAKRILIIDLDVHQGNGTAEIFYNVPEVFTFSMHGANNFPHRKEKSDLDIALPDGVKDKEFLDILAKQLPALLDVQKPDFIFYLSGVDVLESDKLGKLALSKGACLKRDRMVFDTCYQAGIPVQVSMGGGYSTHIKDIVDAHVNTYVAAIERYF